MEEFSHYVPIITLLINGVILIVGIALFLNRKDSSLHEKIVIMKSKIENVELQVTNHIPTSIRELKADVRCNSENINKIIPEIAVLDQKIQDHIKHN